jgi:hypothetical protein
MNERLWFNPHILPSVEMELAFEARYHIYLNTSQEFVSIPHLKNCGVPYNHTQNYAHTHTHTHTELHSMDPASAY